MIIISEASKHLFMLELMVPREEHIEEANKRKCTKYQELVEECRETCKDILGTHIEVGCRDFSGCSFCRVFSRLGITGGAKKRADQASAGSPGKGWGML